MSSIYFNSNKPTESHSLDRQEYIDSQVSVEAQHELIQQYFSDMNEMVISNNHELIHDLIPMIQEKPLVQEHLFTLIERSKTEEEIATAAANAITLLNAARVNLSCRNFREISIPYADLSNSIITNTDLSDSNLTHVRLSNAVLDFSCLENCQFKGVEFEEKPYVRLENIKGISKDGKKVLFGFFVRDLSCEDLVDTKLQLEKGLDYSCEIISPDGEYVAAHAKKKEGKGFYLIIWKTNTGENLFKLNLNEEIQSLNFSFDSKWVILKSLKTFVVIQVREKKEVFRLKTEKETLFLSFSDDQKRVFFSEKKGSTKLFSVWHLGTSKRQTLLTIDTCMGSYDIISPDGKWLLTNNDLYNCETKVKQGRYHSHECASFSPNSKLILSYSGIKVSVEDNETGKKLGSLYLHTTSSKNQSVFLSLDGSKIIYFDEKIIKIWDLNQINHIQNEKTEFYYHNGDVRITPNGKKIYISREDRINTLFSCVDSLTGTTTQSCVGYGGSVGSSFSPGWALLDHRLIDLDDGKVVISFNNHKNLFIEPTSLLFDSSQNGEWILTSSACSRELTENNWPGSYVILWDRSTKDVRLSLIENDQVKNIALSPNGRWVFTLACNEISTFFTSDPISYTAKLWDCHIDNLTTPFNEKQAEVVYSAKGETPILHAFSQDSSWFLTLIDDTDTNDRMITLWNCENRQIVYTLKEALPLNRHWFVCQPVFSPDSQWFYTYQADKITVFNCKEHRKYTLEHHDKFVICADFSPRGEWILSGSQGSTVKLWNWRKEKELLSFKLAFGIQQIKFFPDGRHFLIHTYPLALQKWQLFDQENQMKPALIWSTASSVLSANHLRLSRAKGLTESDKRLLEQNGTCITYEETFVKSMYSSDEEEEKDLVISPFQFKNTNSASFSIAEQLSPILPLPSSNSQILRPQYTEEALSYQIATTERLASAFLNDDESTLNLRKEIESLRKQLGDFNGNSSELKLLISDKQQALVKESERQTLFADALLSDYYYVFYTQMTDVWFASKAIHSEMIKNDQMNKIDYLPALLEKGAEYVSLPGISLLKDVLSFGINAWSDYDKKIRVNRLVKFFGTISETDEFIEALARRLTFAQANKIKALIVEKKGVFKRFAEKVVKYKNSITANDLDTVIKACAAEDADKILTAIMEGKLQPHPTLEAIPSIIHDLFELSVPPVSAISSPNTHSNNNSAVANNTAVGMGTTNQNINQVSPVSGQSLSPASPLAIEQLQQKFETLEEKFQKQEAEMQNLKAQSKTQKNQTSRDLKIQDALKEFDKIKELFSGSQILMPEPGQDTKSLAKLLGQLSKQMDHLTTKVAQLEETTGHSSPSTEPSAVQKEKAKKIREELYTRV